MRKSQNKKKLSRYTSVKQLSTLLPILLFAVVGGYFVISSQAQSTIDLNTDNRFTGYTHTAHFDTLTTTPQGVTSNPYTTAGTHQFSRERVDTPAYQLIAVTSYSTKYWKFISGNCVWQYGCAVSTMDTANLPGGTNSHMHKARIAICFNVPANAVIPRQQALTYIFQRTSIAVPENSSPSPLSNSFTTADYVALGSCEANPSAAGYVQRGSAIGCGEGGPNRACDNGEGPGAGPGIFTGMAGPGTGTGNNNTGTGTNGVGTGPGGGGGGGFSATQQGDAPSTTPSASAQVTDAEQSDLNPSPFFDGKQYEPGSDPDLLGVNTTFSVAGHQLKYGWLYVVAAVLAGAGTYLLWWKRLPIKEQTRLKTKLHLGK